MEKEIIVTSNDNLDSIVYELLASKARGEKAYCNFHGHVLHSDIVSMDYAYKQVFGMYKEEYERKKHMQEDSYEREKKVNSISKEDYQRIIDSKKDETPITKEKVINGIKFIIENQSLSQEELLNGLLELNCNFTINDIANMFPETIAVPQGIREGNLACGALVIINMRDSEYGRAYCTDNFLNIDNDFSLYHFIRLTTGDENYTKENIESKRK